MKSRCKECVHRKVCPYKEYFTEKEADGICKCSNFMKPKKTNLVITLPQDVVITQDYLNSLISWLCYFTHKHYVIRQGGKDVIEITVTNTHKYIDIKINDLRGK